MAARIQGDGLRGLRGRPKGIKSARSSLPHTMAASLRARLPFWTELSLKDVHTAASRQRVKIEATQWLAVHAGTRELVVLVRVRYPKP